MQLRPHLRCHGTLANGTLQLQGRNISASASLHGNVHWYLCGPGAAQEGFQPQQWVARINNTWYIRPTGNNGQRGQYRIIGGHWETQMVKATTAQTRALNTALN